MEYDDRRYSSIPGKEPKGRGFTSRALNNENSKHNSKFDKLGEKPHFYPSENPTSATFETITTTEKSTTVTDKISVTTTTTPNTNSTVTTTPNSTDLTSSNNSRDKSENDTLSTTPVVTLSETIKIQNLSINEIPGQIDRFDPNVDDLTEFPILDFDEAKIPEDEMTTTKFPDLESIDRIDDILDEVDEEETEDEIEAESEQQQFRPRPEYRPPETKNNGSNMEGQLFQDVAAKEKQKQPLHKGQGM